MHNIKIKTNKLKTPANSNKMGSIQMFDIIDSKLTMSSINDEAAEKKKMSDQQPS